MIWIAAFVLAAWCLLALLGVSIDLLIGFVVFVIACRVAVWLIVRYRPPVVR